MTHEVYINMFGKVTLIRAYDDPELAVECAKRFIDKRYPLQESYNSGNIIFLYVSTIEKYSVFIQNNSSNQVKSRPI